MTTKTIAKGTNRAAAQARTGKAAQRTPLPRDLDESDVIADGERMADESQRRTETTAMTAAGLRALLKDLGVNGYNSRTPKPELVRLALEAVEAAKETPAEE